MLNNNELQALNAILEVAIIKSKDEDDGDPIFHEVNINDVNPFQEKRTQSEVYDVLAKKGYIEGSVFEDKNGIEEYVCITPDGMEALISASGKH